MGSALFEQVDCSIPQLLVATAMSAVNLAQSFYNSPTVNFESALYAFSDRFESESSVLFSAGCHVNDTSSCTAA